MLSPEIEKPLSQIEAQCDVVLAAVESGDPVALETAGSALRQAAVDFSKLLEGGLADALPSKEFRFRVKKIADEIIIQRENLIRRTVHVERVLHAIVPAMRTATYSSASGPYGGAAKQTGAFRVLSA